MSTLIEIGNALEKGKKKLVVQYVQQALEEGHSAQEILTEGLLPGMDRVGVKFRANEIFVPEVLVAARAMNAGAALLKPLLAEAGGGKPGRDGAGHCQGRPARHRQEPGEDDGGGQGHRSGGPGRRRGAPGYSSKPLLSNSAGIIGCSALLTTTMPVMADVVKAAEEAGIRDKVKIMVGGAPVTQEFCRQHRRGLLHRGRGLRRGVRGPDPVRQGLKGAAG